MVHLVYLFFIFSIKKNIVYLLIYIVEIKVPRTTTRVDDREVIEYQTERGINYRR